MKVYKIYYDYSPNCTTSTIEGLLIIAAASLEEAIKIGEELTPPVKFTLDDVQEFNMDEPVVIEYCNHVII